MTKMTTEDKAMLGTPEAAKYLGVNERALADNWKRWGLQPYRVGKRLVYRIADLESYLKAHQERAA